MQIGPSSDTLKPHKDFITCFINKGKDNANDLRVLMGTLSRVVAMKKFCDGRSRYSTGWTIRCASCCGFMEGEIYRDLASSREGAESLVSDEEKGLDYELVRKFSLNCFFSRLAAI